MTTSPAGRRRAGGRFGRQADAERNDLLVLAAARAVFAEQGPDAPVTAIADLAGVGIATFYRRYGSKEQMLQRLCVTAIVRTIEALREALDQDGDGWTSLSGFIEHSVADRAGAFAPLAGSLPIPEDVAEGNERAKALLEQLIRKGQQDGSVRQDVTAVDVTHLVEMFSRYPQRTQEDTDARRRLLALSTEGLRPGATKLPGPLPSWDAYEAQWRTSE